MLSLGLEKGRPLIWVLAMIPVTTLADGWVPPRTSCMKKVSGGICGPGVAEVAVVTGVGPVGEVAAAVVVVVGLVTGATPATGVGMVLGTGTFGWATGLTIGATGVVSTSGVSGSGCGVSTTGSTIGLTTGATGVVFASGVSGSGSGESVSSTTVVGAVVVVAGIWPLGNVVVGPTVGVTFGTVVVAGLDN